MSNTAIVIGATGVVGHELVTQLAQAKHIDRVRSLTRRPVEYPPPLQERVDNHVIDFAQPAATADLFKGDLLFSCLGTTLKQAGSVAAQRQVDLEYQYECAALAAQQGVKHYFLVSSSGANRRSPFAYPKMKGELEHAVQQLPFTSITILQPSLLLGQRQDHRPAEVAAAKLLPILTRLPGLNKYRPITGAQVAERLVQESKHSSTGSKTISLEQIFTR